MESGYGLGNQLESKCLACSITKVKRTLNRYLDPVNLTILRKKNAKKNSFSKLLLGTKPLLDF